MDFMLSVNTACYVISVRRFGSLPVIFLLTLGFFVAAISNALQKNGCGLMRSTRKDNINNRLEQC